MAAADTARGMCRSGKWAVPMSEYKDGVVGAKSKNLAALRGELPEWIALPSSVTLPFGCFEKALDDRANADVKRRLLESAKLVPDNPAQHLYDCRCGAPPVNLHNPRSLLGVTALWGRSCWHDVSPTTAWAVCREAVKGMVLPAVLQEELAEQMRQAGIPLPEGRERWAQAEAAIIGVWASKFNDRAYFSMRKVGLDFMDLRMAVLVQRVVPAEYAFVIHTVNPSTGLPPSPFSLVVYHWLCRACGRATAALCLACLHMARPELRLCSCVCVCVYQMVLLPCMQTTGKPMPHTLLAQ